MTHTTRRRVAAPVAALLPCALSLLRWWAAALLLATLAGLLTLLHGWAREWDGTAFLTLLLVMAILLSLHAVAVLAALMIVVEHARSGAASLENTATSPFSERQSEAPGLDDASASLLPGNKWLLPRG